MSKIRLTIITLIIFLPAIASAAEIHVPGDYPTIQAGINAASNGDTVLVADGTYTGNGNKMLEFHGKAIIVRSENGPEHCVIDCEDYGPGFWFHGGEGEDSVVNGFKIQNGYGGDGGGILCTNNSSPTIMNNIITGNRALYGGGGIACGYNSNPEIIINNIITGNAAQFGGGIFCVQASTKILNNEISMNTGYDDVGGIVCLDSSPIIKNNIITGNESGWIGGGIAVIDSMVEITNNTIAWNTAVSKGGGIEFRGSSLTITNSILWGNIPDQIYASSGAITVTYSDIQGGYSGDGNINQDPLFVNGFYLSQIAAGQSVNSPCVNKGNTEAVNLGLHIRTTRTDYVGDVGIVDMGYHYEIPDNEPDTIVCLQQKWEF